MPPTAAVHPDGADADSPARMKLEISIYTMVAKMNPPKMPTEGNAPRPSGKSGNCGKPVHHLCAAFDRRQKNL